MPLAPKVKIPLSMADTAVPQPLWVMMEMVMVKPSLKCLVVQIIDSQCYFQLVYLKPMKYCPQQN